MFDIVIAFFKIKNQEKISNFQINVVINKTYDRLDFGNFFFILTNI